MGDIIIMGGVTRLPIPVDRVLNAALEAGLSEVVVIGYDKGGEEYFAASEPDGPSVLWLMERMKKQLLAIPDRES